MKVLITGAGGFLCKGLIIPFEENGVDLRLMDVCDFESPHEKFIGDVSKLADVEKAVAGVDAIVIGHMASRQAGAYDEVELPFDVNVKGTALLFAAAIKAGIKRIALISSNAAISVAEKKAGFASRDLPWGGTGMYGMTKVCQEVIAEQYARENGLTVSSIRTAYIHDMDTMSDKYGRVAKEINAQYADRRDIGEVTRLALNLEGPRYEIFYALSTPEADERYDMAYVKETLNWAPKYTYEGVKRG